MSSTGGLKKLTIESYSDSEQTKDKKVFTTFFNPSSFQAGYGLKYKETMPQGQTKQVMEYAGYEPTTYSFELLLDGTGASIPSGVPSEDLSNNKLDVKKKIDSFMDVVYNYSGDTHRSNYLKVVWGASSIDKCVLITVNITYDLFDVDANPLRAKLACAFKEYSYEDLIKAEENKKSPDITHSRVIKQGDKLPLLCEQIYGDAKLYLEVARSNGLTHYRNLVPGQKIFFPPLIKNS